MIAGVLFLIALAPGALFVVVGALSLTLAR